MKDVILDIRNKLHWKANRDLPDVQRGDGNFVDVMALTVKGNYGEMTYGCSGAPGESYSFFNTMLTLDGGRFHLDSEEEVVAWHYLEETKRNAPRMDIFDLMSRLGVSDDYHPGITAEEAAETIRSGIQDLHGAVIAEDVDDIFLRDAENDNIYLEEGLEDLRNYLLELQGKNDSLTKRNKRGERQ